MVPISHSFVDILVVLGFLIAVLNCVLSTAHGTKRTNSSTRVHAGIILIAPAFHPTVVNQQTGHPFEYASTTPSTPCKLNAMIMELQVGYHILTA